VSRVSALSGVTRRFALPLAPMIAGVVASRVSR
jgi:hypothetical protein